MMFRTNVLAKTADHISKLRAEHVDLSARIAEHRRFDGPDRERMATRLRDTALSMLMMVATEIEQRLAGLADVAYDADQRKRMFQTEHGIYRDLLQPNLLVTSFLLMLGWLIETVFTTVGLYADGHHDLIPAAGFAITFSTVNVCLGLAAGFCLRFVLRGHWLAIVGFVLIIIVDAAIIFVAGRVRVKGSHEAVFEFSSVPLSAL